MKPVLERTRSSLRGEKEHLFNNKRYSGAHTLRPSKGGPQKCRSVVLRCCRFAVTTCHFRGVLLLKVLQLRVEPIFLKKPGWCLRNRKTDIYLTVISPQLKQQGFCPKSHERIHLKKDTRSCHWNKLFIVFPLSLGMFLRHKLHFKTQKNFSN